MHLAAAAPVIPWSDLAYSLMPNGRTLDYQVTSPTADLSPIGVEKQSFVSGLFALGAAGGYYTPPTDPQADLPAWYRAAQRRRAVRHQSRGAGDHHADRALPLRLLPARRRLRNRQAVAGAAADRQRLHRRPVPGRRGDALLQPRARAVPVGSDRAVDGDFGHLRAQNKPADKALLSSRIQTLFDYYVKGARRHARSSARRRLIETCPSTARPAARSARRRGPACIPARSTSARRRPDDPARPRATPRSRGDRPDRRRRRLRDRLGHRPGPRRRHLPPAGRDRPRLHAAGLADGRSPTLERHRRSSRDRGAAVGRRPRDEHRDARRPRHLPRRREPAAARSSSCTRARGTSPPATSPSSSCSARTRRTRGRPTASSRSRSAACSCACRCTMRPAARPRSDSRSRTRTAELARERAGSVNQNVTHVPRVGRKLGA